MRKVISQSSSKGGDKSCRSLETHLAIELPEGWETRFLMSIETGYMKSGATEFTILPVTGCMKSEATGFTILLATGYTKFETTLSGEMLGYLIHRVIGGLRNSSLACLRTWCREVIAIGVPKN